MADPNQNQNLNQSSPGALSTGSPPSLSPPLSPAPQTPSTGARSAAPPVVNNVPGPTTVAGGGSTQTPSGTAGGNTQAAVANGAGGGASPSSANGLGGNVVPVPATLGDALSTCCSSTGGSGSSGGGSGVFNGPIVQFLSQLTAALAASVPKNTQAIVQSTGNLFITYDNVNWSPLSS